MPRFLVLYRGDVIPVADTPVEQNDQVMDRWGEWMERNGAAIEDPGLPFGGSVAFDSEGNGQVPTNMSGYSIVQAESLDAAEELCRDHPFLHDTGLGYTIEIFELLPI